METIKTSPEHERGSEESRDRENEPRSAESEPVKIEQDEKLDDRRERITKARVEIAHQAQDVELKPNVTAPSGYFYGTEKKQSFKKTMQRVRSNLTKPEQLFSKLVHLKPVELTTDIAAKTVFRPTPILVGGLFSTIITGSIYLLARLRGYGIPGVGWVIVSFILGYMAGLFIDLVRLFFVRRKV